MAKTIVFETINPDYKAEHIRVEIRPHNPVTQCLIAHQFEPVIGNYWKTLAEGMSVCKHGDAYDLETGCRMALISALRKVREKAIRRAVWTEYLKLFPVSGRSKTKTTRLSWDFPSDGLQNGQTFTFTANFIDGKRV